MNPLKALHQYGQSAWLDYVRRSLITSGGLNALIDEDGLRGVTSNPSIFEKAIAGSTDYDEDFKSFEAGRDVEPGDIYEHLAIADIQGAADVLRPVYQATKRRDGYISLEVSPYLAHDTQATIAEAHRLWKAVARENVMIKVPATDEGVPAIRQLIGEGINVNVTLLFARRAYEAVAAAYLDGLEALAGRGGDLARVASVASFFVSRIDTAVDAEIEQRLKASTKPDERRDLAALAGKIAIANAKLAYQHYKQLLDSGRWRSLAQKGAQSQRLLWASTGTKNPKYSDVLYVEELIGADTVNTMPPATMDAFRDHGRARPSLEEGVEDAAATMAAVDRLGIPLAAITDLLVVDGVRLFADAFDKLLSAVARKRAAILGGALGRQSYSLPDALDQQVKASLEEWRAAGNVRRLWARDAQLWTGADEAKWLGWLSVTDDQLAHIGHLKSLAEEVRREAVPHVLLLGMGGSSLGPEVLAETFGHQQGFPTLHVLDSTDPAQIKSFESRIDLARTLFIVSSKSGTTLEPNIFKQYFFDRPSKAVGPAAAGSRFIAITDPGSKMQKVAEAEGFAHVYFGLPSIGGRYSVLSDFGMVAAAIMGLDTARLLDDTEEMVHSCAPSVPPADNPGVVLGTILGVLGKSGRDKVTIVTSPALADFGAWLEQLLAESTGKQGKGLIPVDAEPLGDPAVYGEDRLFAYMRLDGDADPAHEAAVAALERAGQPVVRTVLEERYQIGQEFFRWEMATAVAGAIIGINPFDQPDVEASKLKTRELTDAYEKTGALPAEAPFFTGDGFKLFADPRNAKAIADGGGQSLTDLLKRHLDRLGAGDYFALLAYVERNAPHRDRLQAIRVMIRDAKRVATCLGFGPRFLHSTGQAYKGGPNSGVFLQITCDDAADLPVPGKRYSFGVVKAAQARGDFEVLAERGRRALRVHLGADVAAGLDRLHDAIRQALA